MMKKIIVPLLSVLFSLTVYGQEVNPIETVSHDPGLCGIIHRWGFIGDSLSSGEFEYRKDDGSKGYVDLYEYSWGQRLCAATGTTGENYSKGGETTKGWIEHFWDNPANSARDAKARPKQAYIIALGVNDGHAKMPVGDVFKDVDTTDFTKNAPTFAGYYAGIIQRVKSIQPDAKFFVVTMPRSGSTKAKYNKPIREMAERFANVYVIDLFKYAPDYSAGKEFHNRYFAGGHLNAAGYQQTAYMFMTYINWIIENNFDEFRNTGFIGTQYKPYL